MYNLFVSSHISAGLSLKILLYHKLLVRYFSTHQHPGSLFQVIICVYWMNRIGLQWNQTWLSVYLAFFSLAMSVQFFIRPLHSHHRRAHGLSGLPNPARTVITCSFAITTYILVFPCPLCH
jgi:hypothetical protein